MLTNNLSPMETCSFSMDYNNEENEIDISTKSIDLESLKKYRSQVRSLNKSIELPEEKELEHDLYCAARRIRGQLKALNKIKSLGLCDVQQLSLEAKIRQEARDKRRALVHKNVERYKRQREFDAKQLAFSNNIRLLKKEGLLQQNGRLNLQIQNEKRWQSRCRLPAANRYVQFKLEENWFPDLPAEAEALIRRIWSRDNPSEVVAEGFNVKLTRKDLCTLSGLNWLNDEVINYYLSLVAKRSETDSSLPKTYNFSTFFLKTLSDRGYAGVKRWTRKVDIFSYDIILVPVHLGNHWCLSVIDIPNKKVMYFDSLGSRNQPVLDNLQMYLCEEYMDKKKIPLDLSGWTFDCPQVPQQLNGSDCGVFTSCFAEFSSRRCDFEFDQMVMPKFRRRMVYEICSSRLMV